MTTDYLARSNAWCAALRWLMGYPTPGLPIDTTAWCSSAPRTALDISEVTQIAQDKGADLVHIAMSLDREEPLAVSLALRQRGRVDWLPDVRLYAADDAASIALLAAGQRWAIGQDYLLSASVLPAVEERARGEAIAWRRWRAAVASACVPQIGGSVWVPRGRRYADAIPQDRLKAA